MGRNDQYRLRRKGFGPGDGGLMDDLIYYGYHGNAAWAFNTAEELGAWTAEHPDGTFDVQVREQ
jgi:hypothetical protein